MPSLFEQWLEDTSKRPGPTPARGPVYDVSTNRNIPRRVYENTQRPGISWIQNGRELTTKEIGLPPKKPIQYSADPREMSGEPEMGETDWGSRETYDEMRKLMPEVNESTFGKFMQAVQKMQEQGEPVGQVFEPEVLQMEPMTIQVEPKENLDMEEIERNFRKKSKQQSFDAAR